MSEYNDDKEAIRRKVLGLGEDSVSKSYYPQLQQHIHELEQKTKALETKTIELNKTIEDLVNTKILLEIEEERFRELFESANDAIFIFDTVDHCVECNNQALKLLQYDSKNDVMGLSPIDFSPEYQANGELTVTALENYKTKLMGGESQIFDWVVIRKDKSLAYTEASLNSITIGDNNYVQAIVRDITKLKKLEQDFSLATIRTEERERVRFAKELHDGIGPILSTIKLYLQWLNDTDNQDHIEIIKKKINESINEATKSIKEVSQNLSPHVLTNYGLIEALNIFIEKIKETGKLQVNLKHNLSQRLDKDLEVMFYRVTTELINNTIKHAGASTSEITIKKEGEIIYFTYSDDGKGLSEDHRNKTNLGMGINNIINRVKSVGGIIDFKQKKGKGFKVKIIVATHLSNGNDID
ncbi:PAS domain S-box protein [Carboxylicivirga caseinilyticus]|uniref:PAS domain-containing sensor histidine kinase n=1 Tax=Carboxylicivirga caseinilyticus TaxID=3417572 RepID=UPI003D354B0E|nr:PAS domain S-box protein [Marinilabiliaceae bacterium A049]